MDWSWANKPPSGGSSNGIQTLRVDEDDVACLTTANSITAVDPGGSTGICTVWYSAKKLADPGTPLLHSLYAWQADGLHGGENEQTLAVLRWFANRSAGPDLSDLAPSHSTAHGRTLVPSHRTLPAALSFQSRARLEI